MAMTWAESESAWLYHHNPILTREHVQCTRLSWNWNIFALSCSFFSRFDVARIDRSFICRAIAHTPIAWEAKKRRGEEGGGKWQEPLQINCAQTMRKTRWKTVVLTPASAVAVVIICIETTIATCAHSAQSHKMKDLALAIRRIDARKRLHRQSQVERISVYSWHIHTQNEKAQEIVINKFPEWKWNVCRLYEIQLPGANSRWAAETTTLLHRMQWVEWMTIRRSAKTRKYLPKCGSEVRAKTGNLNEFCYSSVCVCALSSSYSTWMGFFCMRGRWCME